LFPKTSQKLLKENYRKNLMLRITSNTISSHGDISGGFKTIRNQNSNARRDYMVRTTKGSDYGLNQVYTQP
jgi:hypothetical protein